MQHAVRTYSRDAIDLTHCLGETALCVKVDRAAARQLRQADAGNAPATRVAAFDEHVAARLSQPLA